VKVIESAGEGRGATSLPLPVILSEAKDLREAMNLLCRTSQEIVMLIERCARSFDSGSLRSR
jgi:hypothetical protein